VNLAGLNESMLSRRYSNLPFVREMLKRSLSMRASFWRWFRVCWSCDVNRPSFIFSSKSSISLNSDWMSIVS